MSKRRTLTKSDLCRLFDLVSSKGQLYFNRLRQDYFTDEVLAACELSAEDWERAQRGRPFTYNQTQRIIAYFNIEAEELEEL